MCETKSWFLHQRKIVRERAQAMHTITNFQLITTQASRKRRMQRDLWIPRATATAFPKTTMHNCGILITHNAEVIQETNFRMAKCIHWLIRTSASPLLLHLTKTSTPYLVCQALEFFLPSLLRTNRNLLGCCAAVSPHFNHWLTDWLTPLSRVDHLSVCQARTWLFVVSLCYVWLYVTARWVLLWFDKA